MAKSKNHGNQIKDDELYERLREEGNSKEKSARIANAAHRDGRSAVGRRGGNSPAYEEWTKKELYQRARELDIDGRSDMNKGEIINALRNH
ncbi:MAG: Rho termination factor [Vulcanimicrobiota bacterium]